MPDYATWNPEDKNPDITLSNGDLTAITSGWWDSVRSTVSISSGKPYWEITVDVGAASTAALDVLVANADFTMNQDPLASEDTWSLNGNRYAECMNAGSFLYGNTWGVASDILSVALDMDDGKIWIAKNGVYPNDGNPATGANPMCSDVFGTLFAAITLRPDYQMTANFGASPFSYSVPSGFKSGLYSEPTSITSTLSLVLDIESSLVSTISLVLGIELSSSLNLVNSLNLDLESQLRFLNNILTSLEGDMTLKMKIYELAKTEGSLGLLNHVYDEDMGVTVGEYIFDKTHS